MSPFLIVVDLDSSTWDDVHSDLMEVGQLTNGVPAGRPSMCTGNPGLVQVIDL